MIASPSPFPRRLPQGGLYAVTDGPREDLVGVVRAALEGGALIVQYRDKTRDATRRSREARALVELCAAFGVPLIVNDDVARASGAGGVHVGADDPDVASARAALGTGAIISVSCYDSLQRAREATQAGADYLAFSSPFASHTKPESQPAPASLLRDAGVLGLPLVAIGGITPDHGGSLVAAGADFLAVVSAVFGQPDVRAAAHRFAALFAPRDAA